MKSRPLYEGVDWNKFSLNSLKTSPLVALFTRAWIEIAVSYSDYSSERSPSLRGRGLKLFKTWETTIYCDVALFTRAWIEIMLYNIKYLKYNVALFTRAWIEIRYMISSLKWELSSPSLRGRGLKYIFLMTLRQFFLVALFTRAWIEIFNHFLREFVFRSRPLYEGVDWNRLPVVLPCFGRTSRPLYEGVDWNLQIIWQSAYPS